MSLNIQKNGEQEAEQLLITLLGDSRFGSWVAGEMALGKGETIHPN